MPCLFHHILGIPIPLTSVLKSRVFHSFVHIVARFLLSLRFRCFTGMLTLSTTRCPCLFYFYCISQNHCGVESEFPVSEFILSVYWTNKQAVYIGYLVVLSAKTLKWTFSRTQLWNGNIYLIICYLFVIFNVNLTVAKISFTLYLSCTVKHTLCTHVISCQKLSPISRYRTVNDILVMINDTTRYTRDRIE